MEKAAEIRQQKEDLERAKAAYDQEIQMLHARSHDLEEREARLERESEEVRRLKENSDTKSRVEEERLRSRENSVREQEQALARSVLRFEERQSELAERERLLKSQADRIKADVDGIEKDRGRVKEEVEKVRSLWDTFQNAIAEIKRKADQLAQLESELGRTRADFVSLEARLKEKEVEVAELKMKLHMAQGQIERAGSRAAAEGGVVDAPGVEMQLPKPEPGQSYLIVTDDAGPFYTTYAALLEAGSDGVMVVITHPDKMRKKYNIARGRAMWLTTDRGSGSVHPARLDYELTRDLTRFFKEKPGAVVLLDGIRTLVQANGFDKVANFVKRLCDLAATQNGIVLVPVQPGSFEAQEMTVLKEAFDFVAEPPATPGR
jgi:predicted  nucleic acid-binding Zn-ribbon protein